MQVFRTVMITCILIIWPLVTFESYFCNSCILHKRTRIFIKLHIGSYCYNYIQSYTYQHMHYISYILWYNLTPRMSQPRDASPTTALNAVGGLSVPKSKYGLPNWHHGKPAYFQGGASLCSARGQTACSHITAPRAWVTMACCRCAEACAATVRAEVTARQGQRCSFICQRDLTQQW
jgi:hypothetical protein